MAESGAPASPESGHSGDRGGGAGAREQDRFLPIANIWRVMRKVIPENGKIAKDAKESFQECVSEFIGFITSEASDKCQQEKKKTINGDDLLWAMGTLGFEEYVELLKLYLQLYREGNGKGSRSAGQWGSWGSVQWHVARIGNCSNCSLYGLLGPSFRRRITFEFFLLQTTSNQRIVQVQDMHYSLAFIGTIIIYLSHVYFDMAIF